LSTSFILIIIFFDGVFEYGGDSKFWGYVGTNTELLWVEFCNFVQSHMFVSYLSCSSDLSSGMYCRVK
jgi:hypothetical protein